MFNFWLVWGGGGGSVIFGIAVIFFVGF
jgi:hypothetical protein